MGIYIEDFNPRMSSNNELTSKSHHLELIKRALNPYLYDIIPKFSQNQNQICYNSQDPKVNSCLLIKIREYNKVNNVAIACISKSEKYASIDKLYIARMFRR